MKKYIAMLGFVCAVTAMPAVAAVDVHIGTSPGANPYFFVTAASPTDSVVLANFGDTIMGSEKSFDDKYTFTLPLSGNGSGSVSSSFTSNLDELTITSVLVNGVSQAITTTATGQSLILNNYPVMEGMLNSLEVIGSTAVGATAGTYTGTATFTAAVPEPATWATFLLGFGLMGLAVRRKLVPQLQTA